MKLLIVLALAALALGAAAWLATDSSADEAVVARVLDGDTIELVGGDRVRLVQIDAPERAQECYGNEATAATRRLLPPGTSVEIEQDPALDQVDRFERKLAYVRRGDELVNLTLVREGAASVWLFGGRRGRHASELLGAAEQARAERRGLWAACPFARFDPLTPVESGPA